MKKSLLYIKIIINFLIFIGALLIVLLLLPKLLRFFVPFVIGWIVAMIANPLVRFLETKVKILRKHSSAIIIVVVIAGIIGAAYLLIAALVREIGELSNDLPNIISQVTVQLNHVSEQIHELSLKLPDSLRNIIDNFMSGISNYASDFVNGIEPLSMTTVGNVAGNVAEVFLMTIVTILSAYFFTVNMNEIIEELKKHLPESVTNGWHLIFDNFKTAFGGYFKAQFKIMLILTVIMFIGFEILGVGYSFLLALGIAFLDLLPVFGTGAILWPWAIIEMITGNYMRAVGLIVVYLICQIVKQILQPKMVGDSIGISPLATLIFMFVGYRLYSVLGMILGIPVGMVCINLYRIGAFDRIIRGFRIIVHDINEFRKF
jgi:sporulation integral membrane protein YtvI